MNVELLKAMMNQGYVVQQKHEQHNLFIYNYTAKAQYERVWNEVTLQCRGLILDEHYRVVARPFVKFFNLDECDTIPSSSFEVYEKMDGSLGILYWVHDTPYIATRGSFVSDQAIKANELLHTQYKSVWGQLNPDYTYLFEIIYPENRVVVNYGEREELILLAILDTQQGSELPLEDIGFPVVKRYDGIQDIDRLKKMDEANKEGFVVRFTSGVRLKIKFEEYVRLHRILTQVSNKSIWTLLYMEQPLDSLLDTVPDEFYTWVRATEHKLKQAYLTIEEQCNQDFKILDTKRETAFYFLTCKYPSILFLMANGKKYNQAIWKLVKPTFEKPFKQNTIEL